MLRVHGGRTFEIREGMFVGVVGIDPEGISGRLEDLFEICDSTVWNMNGVLHMLWDSPSPGNSLNV